MGADLYYIRHDMLAADYSELKDELNDAQAEMDKLRSALQVLLDQVDYTAGACGLNEMVGAVLPRQIIQLAHDALKREVHG